MGALFATVGGMYINLPPVLMIPLLLLLAMLGGALWSGIAALCKHFFNMSEFITTLMLNMIAEYLHCGQSATRYLKKMPITPRPRSLPQVVGCLNGAILIKVIVMILAFIIIWFIVNRTTSGYEWRISGQNSLFSRLGGVNVKKNYLAVMLLTGALAGLAGGLVIMSGPHRFIKDIGGNYAWDGIMIAMVANSGIS